MRVVGRNELASDHRSVEFRSAIGLKAAIQSSGFITTKRSLRRTLLFEKDRLGRLDR